MPRASACGKKLDSQVLQHLPEEGPCLLVQLPAQRPRTAIEDHDADIELRQVVRRLEPEQAGADDHGRPAPAPADVLLHLNGVVDRPEHEAPLGAETVDGRNKRGRAGGEHHPVEWDTAPVGEGDLAVFAVDCRHRQSTAVVDPGASQPSRAG